MILRLGFYLDIKPLENYYFFDIFLIFLSRRVKTSILKNAIRLRSVFIVRIVLLLQKYIKNDLCWHDLRCVIVNLGIR